MTNFGWPNVPDYVWNANSIAYHVYHDNQQFLDTLSVSCREGTIKMDENLNYYDSGVISKYVSQNWVTKILGCQPMTGPTDVLFAMRPVYNRATPEVQEIRDKNKDEYMAANSIADARAIDMKYGIIETTNAALEAAKAAGIQQEKDKGMDFAKQIIAWRKAGHSMYAEDVLNMMIEHNIITLSEARRLIQENKEKPQEAKLPKTYLDNGN
jgi:hypothetical protein